MWSSGLVEETCDVEFDKSNGSQEEVIGYDNVGDEEIEEDVYWGYQAGRGE